MHTNPSDNKQPRIHSNTRYSQRTWSVALQGQQARRRGRRWIVVYVTSSGRAHAGRVMVGGNIVHTCDRRVLVIAACKWQVQHRGRILSETLGAASWAPSGWWSEREHLGGRHPAVSGPADSPERCRSSNKSLGQFVERVRDYVLPVIRCRSPFFFIIIFYFHESNLITRELKW